MTQHTHTTENIVNLTPKDWHTSVRYQPKLIYAHSRKYVWKCRLWNVGHLVSASICLLWLFWSLGHAITKPGHFVSVSAYSWAMIGQDWSITTPYSGQDIASCLVFHYRSVHKIRSIEFSIWSFQGERLDRRTKQLSGKYLTWQPFRLNTYSHFSAKPFMVITRDHLYVKIKPY